MKPVLFFLSSIFVLISCSSEPARVVVDRTYLNYDSTKPHIIVFDNKDSFKLTDTILTVKLDRGKHTFSVDKEPAREIWVPDNGGILNLDNHEYVAFDIVYEAQAREESLNFNIVSLKPLVLIDSFVIIPSSSMILTKGGFKGVSDSSIRKILPELMKAKNGNYFSHQGDYDTNENIAGIKKFGKDKLFINKFWDFNLGEEIPETITVTVNKNSLDTKKTKSAMIHADEFLLFARLSPDQYTVKSIQEIMEGKEDQIKDKEKEEAQMKF